MRNWGLKGEGPPRRAVIASLLATGALSLTGCATIRRDSANDAVRRLLILSTQRAFAVLVQPDGFWDSAVARIKLPTLFGKPGGLAAAILRSEVFREQLQHHLNRLAEEAARKVAPLVTRAVRSLSISDAMTILHGESTAATTYLRQSMGAALVNEMIPVLAEVMRASRDPVLAQALSALTGVNLTDAAHALALEADNAIWYEIGAAETEIRANPPVSNDPGLIDALRRR